VTTSALQAVSAVLQLLSWKLRTDECSSWQVLPFIYSASRPQQSRVHFQKCIREQCVCCLCACVCPSPDWMTCITIKLTPQSTKASWQADRHQLMKKLCCSRNQ
jgi:hypothetical protein